MSASLFIAFWARAQRLRDYNYAAADKMPSAKGLISDKNGLFHFNPTATVPGSTHYFKVVETVAPTNYAKGETALIVYQVGKGVTGIKSLDGSTISDSYGPMKKVNTGADVVYTDKDLTYKLHVRRQVPKSDSKGITTASFESVQEQVTVNFTPINVPTSRGTIQLNSDAKSGDIPISVKQMASALNIDPAPTSGSVQFMLSIQPTMADGFTVPVSRIVTFKWGNNGGFYVDSTNTDNMVTDVNTSSVVANDSSNQVNTGDLRVILRRDTLVAKSSAADTSGDKVPVGNATFNLDYEGYGSQTVTTSSGNGSTLIQPIDGLPLGKDVTVTMTQDTAAAGYEKFEATPPVQFTYNSNVGLVLKSFDSVGAITPQINPDSDTPDTDIDEEVMLVTSATGVSSEQYNFGGTQITVPLVPQNKLSLNFAPKVMNFGHADVLSGAQTLDLLPKSTDSSKLANFDLSTLTDTDDQATSTVTDADDFLKAQVTQVGTYNSGWQLKMAMSTLTSEDGSDSITGGSVTMGTPKVTKDSSTTDLNMGMGKTVDMNGDEPVINETKISSYADPEDVVNTGNNSTAGVYNIAWNINDVKMNLPAMVGKLNTNYQSTMSWALTWAP